MGIGSTDVAVYVLFCCMLCHFRAPGHAAVGHAWVALGQSSACTG